MRMLQFAVKWQELLARAAAKQTDNMDHNLTLAKINAWRREMRVRLGINQCFTQRSLSGSTATVGQRSAKDLLKNTD